WRQEQPSLTQLGNPRIVNLNVPIFDFASNESVLVTQISGGNPDLLAETQSDWSFSANWNLPFLEQARLNLNFATNRSDDVSSAFPFLSPAIEAAFPDRVTRDEDGILTEVDLRPVDLFATRSKRISLGLNYSGSIGKEPERRGPPAGARLQGGSAEGRRPGARSAAAEGTGGPPDPFAALRERLCAEDGLAFARRLIAAVENGDPIEDIPGFDAERFRPMLARLKDENGAIDEEKLAGFRKTICDADAGSRQGAGGHRGGSGGSGGGAARFFGGHDDGRARFFLSLTHSVELDREILIAPGGPRLDLLDGDTLTSTGTPRNTSRLEGGLFKGGLGLRVSGRYTGSARINGTGAIGSANLFIDDLARLDLRVFADLGEVLEREDGLLKGMRLSFKVDNVFDGRRLVTDGNGNTPINFQPFLIDPTGRFVGFDLRKLL
ncbi:MAG: hypothetical protein WA908_08635, partial [Pontixanthobacter sp.]